jgi:hypothetical protein
MPQLVYWNVNATSKQYPATMEDNAVFVSGFSPSIFESLMCGETVSAYDMMLKVLNHPQYDIVKVK